MVYIYLHLQVDVCGFHVGEYIPVPWILWVWVSCFMTDPCCRKDIFDRHEWVSF